MATIALTRTADRTALPDPLLVAAALLLALVLPNPAGYVGGGGDDWYYVQAARCIADQGWCVPETHWAARWPLVAPMGAVFATFGYGLVQSMVVPFAYSLLALACFVRLVEAAWGRTTALVAGVAFVATASFAKGLLQPNVETVELGWLTATALAGFWAIRTDRRHWAFVAGLCFGLAVAARMTSLAWLPVLALAALLLPRRQWPLIAFALVGCALPLGLDMLVNGLMAGDPLLSQHLSAAHTRIASSELPPGIDLTRSPILNPQFIGGWAPAMGIEAHWTVKGVLNLLANPQMGPVLLAALALLVIRRRGLTLRAPEVLIAGAAMLYAGALIYGLAIDPKARMFLPVAAIAAALIGRFAVAAWADGERLLVGGLMGVLVLVGTIETAKRFDMGKAGPLAARWAAEAPGAYAIEDASRRFLTFTSGVRALPVWPATERPRLLVLVAGTCSESPAAKGHTLMRAADFGREGDPLELCDFSRADPAAPPRR